MPPAHSLSASREGPSLARGEPWAWVLSPWLRGCPFLGAGVPSEQETRSLWAERDVPAFLAPQLPHGSRRGRSEELGPSRKCRSSVRGKALGTSVAWGGGGGSVWVSHILSLPEAPSPDEEKQF